MYEVKTFTERMGDGKKKFINNEEFKNEYYFIFFIRTDLWKLGKKSENLI